MINLVWLTCSFVSLIFLGVGLVFVALNVGMVKKASRGWRIMSGVAGAMCFFLGSRILIHVQSTNWMPNEIRLTAPKPDEFAFDRFGLPEGTPLDRGSFVIAFDGALKSPRWSVEVLKHSPASVERVGSFREDTSLPKAFRVSDADYKGSGFDIGHLTPAEDQGKKMYDTFIFSNAAPQVPAVNRGVWAQIEKESRLNVSGSRSGWICTIPIFKIVGKPRGSKLETIGEDHLPIPVAFAKSELLVDDGKPIALINWECLNDARVATASVTTKDCLVSTGTLESDSGLIMWPKLSDAEKKEIGP